MMHVNSQIDERALAMVYNPTQTEQTTTLRLPLYYAGLSDRAFIREQEGLPMEYLLDREYCVEVPVKMEPKAVTYFVVASQ